MKTDELDCAAFRNFQIYVHEAVEGGLGDSKAGRTRDVKEVRGKCRLAHIAP